MSHWVYGVDASSDELTLEEAQRLKAAGVQVFAQCLWTGGAQPAPRVINLRNAWLAGIPALVGYVSVAPHHPGAWHVDQAFAGVPDDIWDRLAKVPIDVELAGLHYQTHVVDALDAVASLGKDRDVYTNFNTWVNVLGNPARPAGSGLWNALWDDHPDFDFPSFPYGGWSPAEVWGEQWSGGTYVTGQYVDRNQFRAEALGLELPPAPPAPLPPTWRPTDLEAIRAGASLLHLTAYDGLAHALAQLKLEDRKVLHYLSDHLA